MSTKNDARKGALIILTILLIGANFGPCQAIVSPPRTVQAP